MVFYYDQKSNKNVIAKFMERTILDFNNAKIQEYLEESRITPEELVAYWLKKIK